jgi:transcriptional regulator of NAD metabolism
MKNIYTIFFDPKDVYNYVTIRCKREKFVEELINEGLLEPMENIDDASWVIFENGELLIDKNFSIIFTK